jgi:hypothetical protein
MKTAMSNLIEWAESLKDNQQQCTDWLVIKEKATELLEIEKNQILDAFVDGNDSDAFSFDSDDNAVGKAADEYFNKKYKL